MKNKKIFFIAVISVVLVGTFVVISKIKAWDNDIVFTPNVKIPGSDYFSKPLVIKSGFNLLGEYIKAIYSYGAMLAGAVAMFMLVFAGWRWLMAGGSAEKIANARDTIHGVLVGLILLFGGNLLLSQISQGLVNFNDLSIPPVEVRETDAKMCLLKFPGLPCGEFRNATSSINNGAIQCIGSQCAGNQECIKVGSFESCPGALTEFNKDLKCMCVTTNCDALPFNTKGCSAYPTKDMCQKNTCYGKGINKACGLDEGECHDLEGIDCDTNEMCAPDLDENPKDGSSDYCCDKESWGLDECERREWVNKNDGHECYRY